MSNSVPSESCQPDLPGSGSGSSQIQQLLWIFLVRRISKSVRFWPGPTNKQEPICTLAIHSFFSSSSSLSGPSSLEKFLNVSTCPQCWEKFLLAWWWGHLGPPLSSLTTQSIPSLRSAPSSSCLRLVLKPSPKTC